MSERPAINPVRPTVSLNGSVTLQTTGRGSLQWRFEGVDLPGKTNSSLVLSNLVAEQDGRYSVVVSNATGFITNFTYLSVDPTFTKITEGPIVSDQVKSWAGMFGDYDGDGLLDLVVLGDYFGSGKNTRLYHNLGEGQFRAVTDSPWDSLTDRILYSPWADPDNDGDLDLLLVGHESDQPIFMENGGGGVFTRHTVGTDWTSNQIQIRGWAAAWGDLDHDGLLDAVVGAQRTYAMRNNGDGTFMVMTNSAVYLQGGSTHCYQLIDYDGDGDLDLFMPEEFSASRLYRNEGHWEFTNVTESVLQNRLGTSLNGAWADFDNDGLMDLLITQAGSHCRLFRNSGNGDFLEVMVGSPVVDPSTAQSAAWADHDNDGDLDLFVACNATTGNYLYQNNGNPNRWLKVRLQGTRSNSHGVGARMFATTRFSGKTVRQLRQIQAQSVIQELEAHFGLADARNVILLRVEWPSGAVQELSNVAVDQILTLWEPPALAAAVQPDGACALSIRAEPNRAWRIQASNDLVEWQTLTTMTSGTVGFEFVDSTATGMNCRFYRVGPE
ncbi:MAG: immunoglobulin domain-containing protein [Verrucomicrobia bacterium]|nr:immunoglobulin domain-containing protein [Verrucomicrobiota bacterium]